MIDRHRDLPLVLASAAEIDHGVANVVAPLLSKYGFESSAKGRRWIRARPPIRDVFEIAALKGAWQVPRWGISLDFVPHISGEAVRWHRTSKSAQIDFVFDPVDFFADWQDGWAITALHGEVGVRRDAARVLPLAVEHALGWFSSFEDGDLLGRVEDHRHADRPGRRFGFDNWVQQPLAYAFVLARAGAADNAMAALDRWILTVGVSSGAAERLRALLKSST